MQTPISSQFLVRSLSTKNSLGENFLFRPRPLNFFCTKYPPFLSLTSIFDSWQSVGSGLECLTICVILCPPHLSLREFFRTRGNLSYGWGVINNISLIMLIPCHCEQTRFAWQSVGGSGEWREMCEKLSFKIKKCIFILKAKFFLYFIKLGELVTDCHVTRFAHSSWVTGKRSWVLRIFQAPNNNNKILVDNEKIKNINNSICHCESSLELVTICRQWLGVLNNMCDTLSHICHCESSLELVAICRK